jgi:hypothetical protein
MKIARTKTVLEHRVQARRTTAKISVRTESRTVRDNRRIAVPSRKTTVLFRVPEIGLIRLRSRNVRT